MAAPGLSYTPTAPCISTCHPADTDHGDAPWCDTREHDPPDARSWIRRTLTPRPPRRSWAPCMTAAAMRAGHGMSATPSSPCASPCESGVCFAEGGDVPSQACLPASQVLPLLTSHIEQCRRNLVGLETYVKSTVVAVTTLAAQGRKGKGVQLVEAIAKDLDEAIPRAVQQFRDVAQYLVFTNGMHTMRKPTDRGMSLIMKHLQAAIDAHMACMDAARQAHAAATIAHATEARRRIRATSDAMQRVCTAALETHIPRQRRRVIAVLESVFGRLPQQISLLACSSAAWWSMAIAGVSLTMWRLHRGDVEFTLARESLQWFPRPNSWPQSSSSVLTWLLSKGGPWAIQGDAIRHILFTTCMLATDSSNAFAVAFRHLLVYRWMFGSWVVGSKEEEEEEDEGEERTTQGIAAGILTSGSRWAAYIGLTYVLDNIARWACQFVFWLRFDGGPRTVVHKEPLWNMMHWNLDPTSAPTPTPAPGFAFASAENHSATTMTAMLTQNNKPVAEAIVDHGINYVEELRIKSDTLSSMTASELANDMSTWASSEAAQAQLRADSTAIDVTTTVTGSVHRIQQQAWDRLRAFFSNKPTTPMDIEAALSTMPPNDRQMLTDAKVVVSTGVQAASTVSDLQSAATTSDPLVSNYAECTSDACMGQQLLGISDVLTTFPVTNKAAMCASIAALSSAPAFTNQFKFMGAHSMFTCVSQWRNAEDSTALDRFAEAWLEKLGCTDADLTTDKIAKASAWLRADANLKVLPLVVNMWFPLFPRRENTARTYFRAAMEIADQSIEANFPLPYLREYCESFLFLTVRAFGIHNPSTDSRWDKFKFSVEQGLAATDRSVAAMLAHVGWANPAS